MKAEGLSIRLLGQLSVSRNGEPLPLPASRKVRALIAYLAINRSATRSSLCDLLWEVPNDPRGELRWCLSKMRGVLDEPGKRRVESSNDRIALNVSDCLVDALAVDQALKSGVDALGIEQLRAACDLFNGEFLDGLHIDGSPHFGSWLLAQRHRYKAQHLAVVERLCALAQRGSDEHFQALQAWLQLAPFDRRAHEALMSALAETGRTPDAEAHLALAIRQFEAEGVEWLSLRESWRALRKQSTKTADGAVKTSSVAVETPATEFHSDTASSSRRASVAVMPFSDRGAHDAGRGGMADGLTEDIITRLSKLRTFFVIARGTVYALGERNIGPQEAGRILNVDYVVSGAVHRQTHNVNVSVELVDTRNGRIQWADEFERKPDEAFSALDSIGDRIVAAVAEEVETAERNRAVLKPPNSLDAWEAYHRGLWHMYRFSGEDNQQAERFFGAAVQRDPTFARAHAGLSFTHFQNAFLHRPAERDAQIELAYRTAGQSLMADDRDPAAHWAMGRALWLRGQQDDALRELSRSVELSPNFSLGHYTRGFVECQSGDALAAIEAIDYSRSLSPFDPMQFAMLAARAIAHVRLRNYEEAVSWAVKATARPNAHAHIVAIAVQCLAVADRLDEARAFAAMIRKNHPRYSVEDLLASFRFDKDTAELFRHAARKIGFA